MFLYESRGTLLVASAVSGQMQMIIICLGILLQRSMDADVNDYRLYLSALPDAPRILKIIFKIAGPHARTVYPYISICTYVQTLPNDVSYSHGRGKLPDRTLFNSMPSRDVHHFGARKVG